MYPFDVDKIRKQIDRRIILVVIAEQQFEFANRNPKDNRQTEHCNHKVFDYRLDLLCDRMMR